MAFVFENENRFQFENEEPSTPRFQFVEELQMISPEVQKLRGTPVAPGMPTSVGEMGSARPTKGLEQIATAAAGMPEGLAQLATGITNVPLQMISKVGLAGRYVLEGEPEPMLKAAEEVSKVPALQMYQPQTEVGKAIGGGLTAAPAFETADKLATSIMTKIGVSKENQEGVKTGLMLALMGKAPIESAMKNAYRYVPKPEKPLMPTPDLAGKGKGLEAIIKEGTISPEDLARAKSVIKEQPARRAAYGEADFNFPKAEAKPINESTIKPLLEQNGLEYTGITPAKPGVHDSMVWFTDPATGSTLAMKGSEFTPDALVKKVNDSRKTFKVEQPFKLAEGDVAAGSLAYGQPLPKMAKSINLTKIDEPYIVQKRILDASDLKAKEIQAGREMGRTWKETQADAGLIAAATGENPKKIMSELKKRTTHLDSYTLAAREEMVRQAEELGTLLQKVVEDPSKENIAASNTAMVNLATTEATVAGATSKIARSLNSFKIKAGASIPDILGPLSPEQRATLTEMGLKDPHALLGMVRDSVKPAFKDYFWGYAYSQMLMGPPTWAVNVTSNTLWSGFQKPYHIVRTAIDVPVSKLQGRPREFYLSELKPDMAAMKLGLENGLTSAIKEMAYGAGEDLSKVAMDFPTEVKRHPFQHSPYKAVRTAAPVIEFGTRFMAAQDIIPRAIARETEYSRLAIRKALKEGIRDKQAISARVSELLTNRDPELLKKAEDYSRYVTFTDPPGKLTSALLKARAATPGETGRFLFPFVNTISNLTKRGLEMTPGVGAFLMRGAKGPQVSEAIAKQLIGAGITAYLAVKYANGEMTGQAPSDPAGRDQFYREGKQPNSLRFGDTWISWSRLDFMVPVAGAVAAIGNAYENNPKLEDNEKYQKMIMDAVKTSIDNSYMGNLSNMVQALNSGDARLMKSLASTAFSLAPGSAALRSSAKAFESVGKEGITVKNPRTFKEAIQAQTPFHTEKVPPRLNLWGEPRMAEGGPVRQYSPWKMSTATKDPVEHEMTRLDLQIGLPQRTVNNIKLTDQEYDDYVTRAGQPAKQALDRMIQTAAYKGASDLAKAKIIDGIVSAYRQKAAAEILQTRSADQLKLGASSSLKWSDKQQPKTFDELQKMLGIGKGRFEYAD